MIGDINKTVGDYSNIRLCPSPRGIGPLTVVNIFHNLVDMYVLRTLIEEK
jgi:5,10-methylene-tetrahydrofolate dehydrogenase/methenyl tetrahydrofolate cyclohydrolase